MKNPDFSKIKTLEELIELVTYLRSPEGCPWDAKQTPRSLKPYMLEEVYELFEAIEHDNAAKVSDELGDVLIHIAFQISLAREAGKFNSEDVIAGIRDKMIRRHPHVFGDEVFATHDDQLFAWEQIKKREKEAAGAEKEDTSVLDSLPGQLPPLLKSYRIQGRVSRYKFDWDGHEDIFDKLMEEIGELREALDSQGKDEIEEEIGDVLFTVVNLARKLEVHPNLALERTNAKFSDRFKLMEKMIVADGKTLGRMELEELDKYWEIAKKELKAKKAGS